MFEQLRLEQQQDWRSGRRVGVEAYLARHPDLASDPQSLAALIHGEIELRREAGDVPAIADYVIRYPQCAAELARLLAGASSSPPEPVSYETVVGQVTNVGRVTNVDSSAPRPATPKREPTAPVMSFETVVGDRGASIGANVGASAGSNAVSNAGVAPDRESDSPSGGALMTNVPGANDRGEASVPAGGSVPAGVSAPSGAGAAAALVLNSNRPEIPGYKILNELGRGGMGVVYKARQLSADRIVALKVVRNDVLDALPLDTRASTLDRFRHEAQAAAHLEHDNLVTVYEVGEVDGICFYAMRYVEGRSLYDALKQGPLEQRAAARYLEPVARALHMAHEKGILHRDLKPHNIMIDGRTDRPLLADFGLAKFTQSSNELTHAGELLGTPSYMSPEQACDAASVNASADVYSLGATLYHLITARPPFQAASLTETIRQITSQEPVAPRQLNPSIDRDLETICLKCLQKEPVRRYASAEALADDLQRYLEGRPIVARPLGFFGRTWRWCRRNPASAGLISLAATLACVAVVAILIGYVETKAALAVSDRRLMNAVGVVDDLFTRVSEDELLDEPGMQPLRRDLLRRAKNHYDALRADASDDPRLRKDLALARYRVGVIAHFDEQYAEALVELTEALRMQSDLFRVTPNERSLMKNLADTLNEMGSVHTDQALAQLDDEDVAGASLSLQQAVARYRESVRHRERLAAAPVGQVDDQRKLANAYMNLGNAQRADAVQHLTRESATPTAATANGAADGAEGVPSTDDDAGKRGGTDADGAPTVADVAAPSNSAPSNSAPAGPSAETVALLKEARQNIRRAQEVRAKALDTLASPTLPMALKLRRDLAMGYFNLARVEAQGGGTSAARQSLGQAIEFFRELRRDDPRSLAVIHLQAVTQHFLGELYAGDDSAKAWQEFDEAWRLSEPLARENPTVARYRMEVAQLARARGKLREAQEQFDDAEKEWLTAAATLQALIDDVERTRRVDGAEASHYAGPVVNDRELTNFRADQAEAVYAAGDIADRLGKSDVARKALEEARTLLQSLQKSMPQHKKKRREALELQVREVQDLLDDLASRATPQTRAPPPTDSRQP